MLTFLGRGSAFTDEQNSSFFVENGDLVLIDCPMSSFEKLNDMNMTLFNHVYVLVTHTHGDHISGIGMLIDLLQFSVKTPITVVAPSKEVENELRYLLSNLEGCGDSWYTLTNADELKKEAFTCPLCGGALERKTGPYGDFFGCSNYLRTGCGFKRKISKKR